MQCLLHRFHHLGKSYPRRSRISMHILLFVAATRKRTRKSDDSKNRDKHRASEKRSSGRSSESGRRYSTPRTYLNSGRSSRSAISASKPREQERKSRGSTTVSSSHSRRSRKSERDSTKKKNETASKQPVPELSITLPVEQCSMNASDVVVTTGEDTPKTAAERVVDTSKSSSSGENRCIKRVGDSGPHLSITVNTFTGSSGTERSEAPQRPIIERIQLRDEPHFSQGSTSTPRPSPRLPRRSFNSEMLSVDPDIPLPPPPVPPRPVPVSPTNEKDFLLLPPPPAPPIFTFKQPFFPSVLCVLLLKYVFCFMLKNDVNKEFAPLELNKSADSEYRCIDST
ncbi:hypothetical protein ANCCAN_28279 [Ancylostoma caninum]|uniref:Uncharacterized protein n=1 Tax=Ancylostoma caninum TaxID=29170 RepID=A0A368F1P7_ANCCA|nr:hypothetical protein ANCCAN_28279 [Ancylostoma caninum]